MAKPISPGLSLVFLTIIVGLPVWDTGSQPQWTMSMLGLGLLAFVYWSLGSSTNAVPPIGRWLGWATLLFPCYAAFQLVPLPLSWVRIISPARAQLLEALANVMPGENYAALSIVPPATHAHLLRVAGYALIFLLIREIAWRSSQRPWVAVYPVVFIAGSEAALGTAQFLWNSAGGVATGTYPNKNHFAAFLEIGLPLALMCGMALLRQARSQPASTHLALKGGFLLFLAALMLCAITWSFSRAGLIACLGSLIAISVLALGARRSLHIKFAAAIVVGVVLSLAAAFFTPMQLMNRYVQTGEHVTNEVRLRIWSDTLHFIAAYPLFGCGLGAYGSGSVKYQTASVEFAYQFAHNDYLQLLAELGLIGFPIPAALMAALVAISLRTSGLNRNKRYLALGCTGALTAILTHSLVDFNLYIPANALVLAWIAGIAASVPLLSRSAPIQQKGISALFVRRFGMVLSCILVIDASARMLSETRFVQSDMRLARLLCRFGICNSGSVIAGKQDLNSLQEALRGDSAEPYHWCELGEAFRQSGQLEQAGFCFSQAIVLGPNIPLILLKSANYHFAVGETRQSLSFTAHLLSKSTLYDNAVFNSYLRKSIDVNETLRYGLPQDSRVSQAYVRYLIHNGKIPDIVRAWDWVVSHSYADDKLASEYIRFLVKEHLYEVGAQSWAAYVGNRRMGYLQSTWLFNGDFELDPAGSAFDWRLAQTKEPEVTLDSSVAHSGSRSLRIRFHGVDNLNYDGTTQVAYVKPGQYHFEAYVRTENINTEQGIGFRIFDQEQPLRLDVKTKHVEGTSGWRKIETNFGVPRETNLIEVQAIRQPSWIDDKINGTAWIDSVRLERLK